MPRKRSDQPFTYAGFPSPNGTVVPDDVFDVLMPELTEAELRVLLYVIRRTFGFKKDSDSISLSQMVDGVKTRDGRVLDRGTGMSRRGVMKGCAGLLEKGIVQVERRLSEQGDNEINIYRLRFRSDTGVGNDVPYRREPSAPPVGNDVPPQQTVLQPTSTTTSNVRSASHAVDNSGSEHGTEVARRGRNRTGADAHAAASSGPRQEDPSGVEPVGSVLARRRGRSRKAYDEDREVILAYIEDFAREFNDRAPLTSSVSRAYNLYRRSGLTREVFIDRLYAARATTKERSATIRSRAGEDGFGLPVKAKMAFFFACLEDGLGLPHEPDAHPPPG